MTFIIEVISHIWTIWHEWNNSHPKMRLLGCELCKNVFFTKCEVHKNSSSHFAKFTKILLRTLRSSQEIFAFAMRSSHCELREKNFHAKFVETLGRSQHSFCIVQPCFGVCKHIASVTDQQLRFLIRLHQYIIYYIRHITI